MTARVDAGRLDNPFRQVAAGRGPRVTVAEAAMEPAETAGVPLTLRPMTGFEEEFVERSGSEGNTAALCNEVLARCHVSPGEPLEEARALVRGLLVAERDAALVRLRRISLGDVVESVVACQSCGHENSVDFRLSDLPTEVPNGPRDVETDLPDGIAVRMRLPTAGDQEDLHAAGLDTAAERRSWLLARVLRSFGADTGPFDADFTQGFTVGQRRGLEAVLEKALPDLDLSMAVSCEHCGAEFTTPFDVAGFFFAEMTDRTRALVAAVHRLASRYHWSESEILSLPIERREAYLAMIAADPERDQFSSVPGD